jgi:leucyl aminopeptidase
MSAERIEFAWSSGKSLPPADALVVALPADMSKRSLRALVRPMPARLSERLLSLLDSGPLPEEVGSLLEQRMGREPIPNLLVVSLGKSGSADAETVRRAAGATTRWANRARIKALAVCGHSLSTSRVAGALGAWTEGTLLSAFRFSRHLSEDKKPAILERVFLRTQRPASAADKHSVHQAATICAAANFARGLAHEPPNVINPVTLAETARQMARQFRLKCTVLDERQLADRKMAAHLAVGLGSSAPPRLITLEYAPQGKARSEPVVIVGKAITFDTGGYSLKPHESIVGMKFDKCGGVAVMAILRAAAELKLKHRIVGIIAAAENMISSRAYRPNDIVRAASGKTIEIISTDAEGRLVLADALHYAQKTYKPRVLLDLATLTGGVIIALGGECAGLFCNDAKLADRLIDCGQRVHERLWRLPLWPEYRDLLKGEDSDIKNSGERVAHPIQGGIFLKEFVDEDVPWAHLDIAGVAHRDKEGPYLAKGASGFGVRLIAEFLSSLK